MAEDKKIDLAEKIEKLIVDGQKEIMDGMASQFQTMKDEFRQGQESLKKEILGKLDSVHSSLKTEISVTAVAVKETVKEEIKLVEDKLDLHMRQPAHAGI